MTDLTRSRPENRYLPPLLFAGVILLIASVHFAVKWHLPTPICWMRVVTGIPCPGCGSTRCLLALSHFDVAQAFRFNPMTFLTCVGAVIWFIAWTADVYWQAQWRARFLQPLRRLPLGVIVLVAVLVNWVYLCLTLP
jgi:hypothetical protein